MGCASQASTTLGRHGAPRFATTRPSRADSLHGLVIGFPAAGHDILNHLQALRTVQGNEFPHYPACLAAAEAAGRQCDAAGWTARPSWEDLAAGCRPPELPQEPTTLGEWTHGWQYHASYNLERAAHLSLMATLGGGPGTRCNAATTGKARVWSCMGAYAASWLTVCPTTDLLGLHSAHMACAVRRRLGIGVICEGGDPHGHAKLTTNNNARLNSRHTWMVSAWRQVFTEAGGLIPDRNVERLLSHTHIPTPQGDTRRLDLVVPCLNVARGLPLFCDVTVISPIAGNGRPRAGTSTRGGRLLEQAERANNDTYHEVLTSGLGSLECLGCEVFGRWGEQSMNLVPALARERCRDLPARMRRGTMMGLLHRWWGLLGVSLQKSVAHIVLHEYADLPTTQVEPICPLSELPVVA